VIARLRAAGAILFGKRHGRVRDGLLDGEQRVWSDPEPVDETRVRVAPPAARPQPSRPAWLPCPGFRHAARSGSGRRCGVVGLKPTYAESADTA